MRQDSSSSGKPTRREHAYRHIYRKLMDGSLRAGARLSPTALAREIGTSHIPVREAISQLQSEGFVVHLAHRGAFVKEAARHELVDLIEIRTILECRAAAMAARRITPAQRCELDGAFDMLCRTAEQFYVHGESSDDPRELMQHWLLADVVFHMGLVCAARNRQMIRVIQDLRIMTQIFGYRTDPPTAWTDRNQFWGENLRVHKDIYDAICRHDPKAAHLAMLVHMRRARKNLLGRFDWLRRSGDVNNSPTWDFPDSVREHIRTIQQNKFAGGSAGADGPSDKR